MVGMAIWIALGVLAFWLCAYLGRQRHDEDNNRHRILWPHQMVVRILRNGKLSQWLLFVMSIGCLVLASICGVYG